GGGQAWAAVLTRQQGTAYLALDQETVLAVLVACTGDGGGESLRVDAVDAGDATATEPIGRLGVQPDAGLIEAQTAAFGLGERTVWRPRPEDDRVRHAKTAAPQLGVAG